MRRQMISDLTQVYDKLYSYCESREFAGHDPFDGLNSRLFARTPLRHSRLARLALIQAVKRSPVDLRPLLRVSAGVNQKGLALFALAEFSRFRTTGDPLHAGNARRLVDNLLGHGIAGKAADGAPTLGFGYNFDWQSRVFFAPVGTPAVVPTAFASQVLVAAYEAFGDERYLAAASEVCGFILTRLNRPVESRDELCLSYTPLDCEVIYNATLLAGESLARVGALMGNSDLLEMASRTARFVIRRQRGDGAWTYGAGGKQGWVDNFHTAYVVLSLHRIASLLPEPQPQISAAARRGMDYWLNNLFLDDGTPKYYDHTVFPVDIHAAAVAIASLSELHSSDPRALPQARKTAVWTLANMYDDDGYFYYQMRRGRTIKTPFLRWGQAWMAYALARLIETEAHSLDPG